MRLKTLEARAVDAKHAMEEEVAKLYEEFHSCGDPSRRAEIKRKLDEMIRRVESKKDSTKIRAQQ